MSALGDPFRWQGQGLINGPTPIVDSRTFLLGCGTLSRSHCPKKGPAAGRGGVWESDDFCASGCPARHLWGAQADHRSLARREPPRVNTTARCSCTRPNWRFGRTHQPPKQRWRLVPTLRLATGGKRSWKIWGSFGPLSEEFSWAVLANRRSPLCGADSLILSRLLELARVGNHQPLEYPLVFPHQIPASNASKGWKVAIKFGKVDKDTLECTT